MLLWIAFYTVLSGTHQRVVKYALQNVELLDDALLYICVCVLLDNKYKEK
jgi:hypothetical protein